MYGLWQDSLRSTNAVEDAGLHSGGSVSLALVLGQHRDFQLLDAVRLKTLPVKDPQQLVQVE